MPERLLTAKLLKPRGLKGEIGIRPFSANPTRYLSLKKCFLEDESGTVLQELEVAEVKLEGKKIFLHFAGYNSREAVAALSNHYLSVEREDAEALAAYEFYVADLIGLAVEDNKHGYLGQVAEVITSSAQALLRIALPGQPDLLVPFVGKAREQVNLTTKTILLDMPAGLYELYRG